MGTHISRVKSVDLDSWTDEQLQSIMKWGNARANRYWESKLAPGHVPSDAKIENFIRTKYESRRWVMDGPIPDPSTLGGDGDEDVPLSTVQARAGLDRSASQRTASGPSRPTQPALRQAPAQAAPSFDLMGDPISVPQRASTTEPPAVSRPPPPQNQPQQSGNLLGGLNDFLSGPPGRPTSTSSGPGGMSRPDLKQSILSLYASKPAAAPPASQVQTHQRQVSSTGGSQGGSFGGLNDAFGGLSFGSGPSTPASAPKTQSPAAQAPSFTAAPKAQAANPNAYAALSGVLSSPQSSIVSPPVTSPPLTGGGFFDAGSKPPAKPAAPVAKSNPAPPLTTQATDDWGDFSMADNPPAPAAAPQAPQQPPANKNAGLLDFTAGGASSFAPPPAATKTTPSMDSSVFNLSSKPAQRPSAAPASNGLNDFPSDPWGSNEWATPDPAPAPAPAPAVKQQPLSPKPAAAASSDFGWSAPADWGASSPAATTVKSSAFDTGGWGDPAPSTSASNGGFGGGFGASVAPKIQPEEDFGGWGTSEPAQAPPRPSAQPQETQPKPSGGAPTSEDLFGNVWG